MAKGNKEKVVKSEKEELPEEVTTSECFGKAFDPEEEECKNCEVKEKCEQIMKSVEGGEKELPKKELSKVVEVPKPVEEPVKGKKEKVRKEKVEGEKKVGRQLDEYGFALGSRKSYIATLLKNSPSTKEQLLGKVTKKFGSGKLGLVNMALTQLKKRAKLKVENGKYSF